MERTFLKRVMALVMIFVLSGAWLHARTLVAYYSFTGNVETIVGELEKQIEADVVEIAPAEEGLDYTANNYAIGSALIAAIRDYPDNPDSYPAIKPVRINLADYDNIIIAAPLWWSQMAAPMQTFLFQNGTMMTGKKIGVIVSSASSGISGVVADAKRLIPGGDFFDTNLWIRSSQVGNAASMISEWLENIDLSSSQNDDAMKIKVTDGDSHTVVFELNQTSAAKSLYGMLPLSVDVSNYSNNEKIFYPPTAIEYGSDCIEGPCPVGTLALFSPWGNVVMYYGAASQYTGLYIMGTAVEGVEQISQLTGTITVEKVADSGQSPVRGDLNADGVVDVEDVNEVINIILK